MIDLHTKRVLILDFGSQYTQLIARRIREIGVYSEVHSYSMSNEDIQHFSPSAIILSGGHETVTSSLTPRIPDAVFTMKCPVLGICYGMQAMAIQLGGKVKPGIKREFGYAEVFIDQDSHLLRGIEDHLTTDGRSRLDVWMSHGDQVSEL